MVKKRTFSLDDLLENKVPEPNNKFVDVDDLVRETRQRKIPRLEEIPLERILHWNHYTCKCCGTEYNCPGSVPQPVFIKTKLLKYNNLTTQQLQDLPHHSCYQDDSTGEVFTNKLDNPWNPTDLPLSIEHHHYYVDRCLNCVSGKGFTKDQMELFS